MQDSTQTAARSRTLWLVVTGMMLALTALMGVLIARQALAATPSGGRLSLANPDLYWLGPTYTPANTVADRTACDIPGRCDEFDLYLDFPANFTATQQITVTIDITVPNELDDYDVYVIGPNGTTVASSTESFGTSEKATIICPTLNFTYTVQVVPYIIQGPVSQYSGHASIEVGPGTTCRPPGPTRASGGLGFDVNTVVDMQRQVGEPDIVWGPPTSTNKLGDVLASGPWGASTEQSFVWFSTDNGETYNSMSKLRPDAGPGGGDTSTEIDDQNHYHFTDLEALQNVAAAISTDGGNTWPRNSVTSYQPVVDRQWHTLDNGTSSGPEDNTQFLTWRQTPLGSFLMSATDGLTYLPAQANPAEAINSGAPCGDLRFDHTLRYLYLPCAKANQVEVAYAHVDVGQRTGIVFEQSLAGNALGSTGNLFPTLATDRAGNVYVAYTDSGDFNTYLVYSTDHAQTWSDPIRLNGNAANTTIFPWIVAGEEGRVAVAYLGTDQYGAPGPDSFPSWFNDKPGSTVAKWYLYVNYLQNANTANPTIYQAQASQHPVHYGQVCTSGTLCLATGGDRTMADFLTIQHDNSGAMRIIYNDTTNQHHGASVMVASQIDGPSMFGTNLSGTPTTNPVTDRTDDAQFPHRDPTGPGPNYDALDITGVGLAADTDNITVTMTISDLTATKIIPGADSVVWMARWQSKSVGDFNEESYRIYYAQAVSTLGGDPEFFYGTSIAVAGPEAGCTTTTPQTCKLLQYPQGESTTGTFDEDTGTITIVVPREGVGSPPVGSTLYSVTGYTYGQRSTSPDFYDDVDVAKAFNYTFTNGQEVTATPTTAPTDVATSTPTRTATSTAVVTAIGTATSTAVVTAIGTATSTAVVTAIGTATSTAVVTAIGTATSTAVATAIGTATSTAVVTAIGTATGTPAIPTSGTATRTAVGTAVVTASVTPTACPVQFQDVPPSTDASSFYPFVRCLACRHIVGGYPCGGTNPQTGEAESCGTTGNPYYRPNNNITRGQISKIVSESGGYTGNPGGQIYEDVAPGDPFYVWINRLTIADVMGGYPCGGPGEACNEDDRPYFRPTSNATRGQLSKIVSNAAGFDEEPEGQTYTDVLPSNDPSSYYPYIERLSSRGVMSGYPCGGAGEECDDQNRAYFRPNNHVTRAQGAKIVANTFFPNCQTPARK